MSEEKWTPPDRIWLSERTASVQGDRNPRYGDWKDGGADALHRDAYLRSTPAREKAEELVAALKLIAGPRYGFEASMTDAEAAEYWSGEVRIFRHIAQKALATLEEDDG